DVDPTVLDRDRVRHDPDARVEQRPSGRDVVLPAVPGAAQYPALEPVLELVDPRGQRRPRHLAEAHPRTLVSADVLERVVLAAEIEAPDLAPLDLQDLASAQRYVLHRRDQVLLGHAGPPAQREFGASRRSP